MVGADVLWGALEDVKDPEIPALSIVDLGMVHRVEHEGEVVLVEAMPTFVGCPALDIIRATIIERLEQVEGIGSVQVRFILHPPWTSDRITARGRERLKTFGIAPPGSGSMGNLIALDEVPHCPHCGSADTHMENLFGPTACRSIYYCDACRQPFEAIKQV